MRFFPYLGLYLLTLIGFSVLFVGEPSGPRLVDVTVESGLQNFIDIQGGSAKQHIVETMGGGCAFLDYDRDGNLDVVLVSGTTVDHYLKQGGDIVCALFRGDGKGHFQDVTAAAGITARSWGMGVAVGDIDNDGWEDIFIPCYGRNVLLRNLGNGKFEEGALQRGVVDPRWSVTASFLDMDRDGDLDLYVSNYLEYDLTRQVKRSAPCVFRGFEVFCGPRGYPGARDALLLNDGTGHFKDVAAERGIDPESLYGMGMAVSDYDNDGWPDIFVANDLTPNLLYHNLGKGQFEEVGISAGVAYDENGIEQGSMAPDFGDFNNDGWLDLFYTASSYQTKELCVNNKDGTFSQRTYAFGLGETTYLHVGWGICFADLNNDGWEDLFIVNAHLYPQADRFDMGLKFKQRKLVFMNDGGKTFRLANDQWGPAVDQPNAARGLAYGDFDNDGDLDILINNQDGPPTLLRNDGGNRQHWLMVGCLGDQSNRSAVGTRLRVRTSQGQQIREIKAGSSYGSQNDPRAHFGLGSAEWVDELEIRWPSGLVEKRQRIKSDQLMRVDEGHLAEAKIR